jgi:phosphoglycolate phosphatase-like HAD superfamily hydrolase
LVDAISRFECVIFDFDGTLVDLHTDWDALKGALGRQFVGADFSKLSLGLDEVQEAYGTHGLRQAYETIHMFELRNGWTLKPYAKSLLLGCKERDQRVGIFSANTEASIRAILSFEDLGSTYRSIVSNDQLRLRKPDPHGLFVSMDRLYAGMQNTVYLADGAHEAHTASLAGVNYIGIESFQTLPLAA